MTLYWLRSCFWALFLCCAWFLLWVLHLQFSAVLHCSPRSFQVLASRFCSHISVDYKPSNYFSHLQNYASCCYRLQSLHKSPDFSLSLCALSNYDSACTAGLSLGSEMSLLLQICEWKLNTCLHLMRYPLLISEQLHLGRINHLREQASAIKTIRIRRIRELLRKPIQHSLIVFLIGVNITASRREITFFLVLFSLNIQLFCVFRNDRAMYLYLYYCVCVLSNLNMKLSLHGCQLSSR